MKYLTNQYNCIVILLFVKNSRLIPTYPLDIEDLIALMFHLILKIVYKILIRTDWYYYDNVGASS